MTTLKEVRGRLNAELGIDSVVDETAKNLWIPRTKYFTEQSHKVRVHTSDGKSEVRFVSDQELEVLHHEPHVTKIVHVNENKAEE
jgi:hypothetical protein